MSGANTPDHPNPEFSLMASKAFILQRICIYAGTTFDPDIDLRVREILRDKFNISLPQRRSLEESMMALATRPEIIGLIMEYRALTASKNKAKAINARRT
jgi:hypothetical protein